MTSNNICIIFSGRFLQKGNWMVTLQLHRTLLQSFSSMWHLLKIYLHFIMMQQFLFILSFSCKNCL